MFVRLYDPDPCRRLPGLDWPALHPLVVAGGHAYPPPAPASTPPPATMRTVAHVRGHSQEQGAHPRPGAPRMAVRVERSGLPTRYPVDDAVRPRRVCGAGTGYPGETPGLFRSWWACLGLLVFGGLFCAGLVVIVRVLLWAVGIWP